MSYRRRLMCGPPLQSVMEAIAACGYGYAYVTEATDFAALSSSWSALVTRAEVGKYFSAGGGEFDVEKVVSIKTTVPVT